MSALAKRMKLWHGWKRVTRNGRFKCNSYSSTLDGIVCAPTRVLSISSGALAFLNRIIVEDWAMKLSELQTGLLRRDAKFLPRRWCGSCLRGRERRKLDGDPA